MSTYTTSTGNVWSLIPGETYDKDGVAHVKAGHASITVSEREGNTPGLAVNVCPTWAHGRTIALRGSVDNGGQARLAIADDVPRLLDILHTDVAELFGAWSTFGLAGGPVSPAPTTSAPTPPVVGADALLELLLPGAPVDPWQAVKDAGVTDDMVAQLIAANVTPEAASLKLGIA